MKTRKIICAACKHPILDLMVVGPRHWDKVMCAQFDAFDRIVINSEGIAPQHWQQGFIDQRGVFLTRRKAMYIAQETGQKIDYKGCGGSQTELYSEGLY